MMTTEGKRLVSAVQAGDRQAVRTLLNLNLDVDQTDDYGWTALSWAAAKGDVEVVRALCESGSNVFHVGKDGRTAYLIALASASVDAASYLKRIEQEHGGDTELRSSRQNQLRPYCKVYSLQQLQRFPAWQERNEISNTFGRLESLGGDSLLFLHQDFRVTLSMWPNEQVVFETDSEDWRQFCLNVLNFHPPSDLDWLSGADW